MLNLILIPFKNFRKLFFFVFLSCSFYTSAQFHISIEKNGFVTKLVFFNDFDAITPDLSKVSSDNFLLDSDIASMKEKHDFQVNTSICSYCYDAFEVNILADDPQQELLPSSKINRQSHHLLLNSYNSFCNSGASMQYAISKNRNWGLNNIKTYCILT